MEDKQNSRMQPGMKGGMGPTKPPKGNKNKNMPQDRFLWIVLITGLFLIFQWVFSSLEESSHQMTYKVFYQTVATNTETGIITSAVKIEDRIIGKFSDGGSFSVNIPAEDQDILRLLRDNIPDFDVRPPQTFFSNLFYSLGPMIIFILFLWFFIYRGATSGGGKMLSV